MKYATETTSGISFVILVEMFSNKSHGSFLKLAVIASWDSTTLSPTILPNFL